MYKLEGTRFCLRRKIFLHINLAESFAQLLVRGAGATLPARANFLGAGENAPIEREILLHKRIREQAGGTINELPAIVSFPVGKRNAGQHAIERLEEVRLSDVDLRELGAAHRLKVCVPGKVRRQRLRVRDAHLMINLFGIAPLHIGHRRLC